MTRVKIGLQFSGVHIHMPTKVPNMFHLLEKEKRIRKQCAMVVGVCPFLFPYLFTLNGKGIALGHDTKSEAICKLHFLFTSIDTQSKKIALNSGNVIVMNR